MLPFDAGCPGDAGARAVELLWFSGARLDGLQAVDLQDVYADEHFIWLKHHSDTGTGFKNNGAVARPVGLPPEVAAVPDEYVTTNRTEKHDEYGRAPLFTPPGQPAEDTIQKWSYLATMPCRHSECPHDKDRATYE